ncbi:MAG TPA: pitrilysin family protein, partial [Ktedonobacterales bacterium]|nr:pitrilysin family protein [Ktedonobacterales bacterium]
AKIASQHFDLALNLLADMVRFPLMESAELEKERRVIIEELSMYRDSPQEWVGVLGDETVWPDLPLGREVAGTRETVGSITREVMECYRRGHYVPGNLVLSVVGDVEHEQVLTAAQRLFGDWEPLPVPRWTPCPIPNGVPRVRLESRRTEQTNLCLYTPGIPRNDLDTYVQSVANAILGDGMSSRLFLRVREEQGLAYDVGTSPMYFHDTGAFVVSAGVEPGRVTAAVRAILDELALLRRELIPADELTRAKEYIKGRTILGLEDTHSVAWWLGNSEALLGEVRELDDVLGRIDAVSAEDVQRLAQSLFRDDGLRLALIGPHKSAARFEQALYLAKRQTRRQKRRGSSHATLYHPASVPRRWTAGNHVRRLLHDGASYPRRVHSGRSRAQSRAGPTAARAVSHVAQPHAARQFRRLASLSQAGGNRDTRTPP